MLRKHPAIRNIILGPFTLLCLSSYSAISSAEIYRWVDDKGRVQFSDKQPAAKPSKNVSSDYASKDPFEIDVDPRSYNLPLKTRGIIRNSILRMGDILTDKLGITYNNDAHINVIIFGNKRDYINYGGRKNTSGFYSFKKNEAVIRANRNINSTLATVVHETSHLLLSYNYGHVPRWLDEGIAEYFEHMRLSFSSVEIPPNRHWSKRLKQRLKTGSLFSVSDFVSLSPRDWILANNQNNDLGYAYSWALVSFLMSNEQGQRTLKQIFTGLKNRKRKRDYSASVIDKTYPGGIKNFENNWHEWIYSKKSSTFY